MQGTISDSPEEERQRVTASAPSASIVATEPWLLNEARGHTGHQLECVTFTRPSRIARTLQMNLKSFLQGHPIVSHACVARCVHLS